MPSVFNEFLDKTKALWGRTTASQRLLIGGLAVTMVAVFFLLIFWLNQPDWKVLYSRLSQEDAATVVKKLQGQKVKYTLESGGDNTTTILVPADKAYDLRLAIAGEGILHGQGLGFEIKVGQTDFVQDRKSTRLNSSH